MTPIEKVWSPIENVKLERRMWYAILWTQVQLGLEFDEPMEPVLHRSISNIHHLTPDVLDRIDRRERRTRHDLKARLEIFAEDTGHEWHHLGCTSADIVENAMQVRMLQSAEHLNRRYQLKLAPAILRWRGQMRGIKGAVGTMQDQVDLLGSIDLAMELDYRFARVFGFQATLGSVGQVYPRSWDFEVLSTVAQSLIGRLPHRGWTAILWGYVSMLTGLDQWNEGDVATSVVRRYAIPAFFVAAEQALTEAERKPQPA